MEIEYSHAVYLGRFKSLILTVIVALAAYFVFVLWGGWQHVADAAYHIGILGVAAALCLSLVNILLRFIRWQHFITLQGYRIPWKSHLRIYVSGFALTPTPAKAGEALRTVFLADYHVPYRASLGVYTSERFSDLLSVLFIISLGVWNFPSLHGFVIFGWCFIVIFLALLQRIDWIKALQDYFRKKKYSKFVHYMDFLIDSILCFNNCFSWKSLLFGTFLGILAWSAQGFAFWYTLKMMGADLSFFWANFDYVLSLLIGSLTFLPGGIGGTEVSLVELQIHQKIDLAIAVAATLFIRFTTLWFSVFVGLLFLPIKRILLMK